MILLFIATLLAILPWYMLYRYRLGQSAGDALLCGLLTGLSQILLEEMLLGLSWSLSAWKLFAVNGIIAAAVIWTSGRAGLNGLFSDFSVSRRSTGAGFSVVKLYAFLPTGFVIATSLLSLGALLMLIAVYGPVSWDDYHYHLGFVADIIQSGKLRYFDYTHPYTVSYPHNIEMFMLWCVVFVGDDNFFELANLFFLFLALLSVGLLCRDLGASRQWSLYGALSLLAVPMNQLMVKTGKVDLALCALFVAALRLLFKVDFAAWARSDRINAFCSLLAVGLMFGSKSSSVIYIAVYFLTAAILCSAQSGRSRPSVLCRRFGVFCFQGGLALLLLGSFWYFRSWYYFSNPLYPLNLQIAGVTFPGPWKDLDFFPGLDDLRRMGFFERLLLVFREKRDWYGAFYLADGKLAGLGAIWYVLMLPAASAGLLWAVLNWHWRVVLVVAAFSLVFILIPGTWIPHYSLGICMMGALMLGWTGSCLFSSRVSRGIFESFYLCCFAFNSLLLVNGGIFSLPETFARIAGDEKLPSKRALLFNKAANYLDENRRAGDVTAVASSVWFPYALQSRGYQSPVLFLPMKDGADKWLINLETERVRFLMVIKDSPEYKLAEDRQDLFSRRLEESHGPHYLYEIEWRDK